jgi:hypothetical protein
MTSALEAFTIADPERNWTPREIARHAAIGGRGPVVVGSFSDVADELEAWVAETGIDGFNLAYAVTPETFTDIVDLVVPELQRRGVYKLDYAAGTLREKPSRCGWARLPSSHPAAKARPLVDLKNSQRQTTLHFNELVRHLDAADGIRGEPMEYGGIRHVAAIGRRTVKTVAPAWWVTLR